MSVVIIFRVEGDSEELLAGYDRTVEVPHPSRLGHLMARTEQGMTGIEVWSSREDLERFMSEELPQIFERADCVDLIPPRVKEIVIAPVHNAHGRFAPEEQTAAQG